jgi:plasmid stability protein
MAMLQVRNVDDKLYTSLKQRADAQNRSVSQEVVSVLEQYLANPDVFNTNSTQEFLNLSWEDDRTAEEIIADIANTRRNKPKFGAFSGVFA